MKYSINEREAIKKPIEGRYMRCSNITSFMGITEDSTESVMKNQKMPKAVRRNV